MPLQADGSWVAVDGSYSRTREQYIADHSKDERAFQQHRAGQRITPAQWKKIWPTTLRYRQVMERLEQDGGSA